MTEDSVDLALSYEVTFGSDLATMVLGELRFTAMLPARHRRAESAEVVMGCAMSWFKRHRGRPETLLRTPKRADAAAGRSTRPVGGG